MQIGNYIFAGIENYKTLESLHVKNGYRTNISTEVYNIDRKYIGDLWIFMTTALFVRFESQLSLSLINYTGFYHYRIVIT